MTAPAKVSFALPAATEQAVDAGRRSGPRGARRGADLGRR